MLDDPEPSSSSPKSPKDKAAEQAPKATPKGQQQENGAAGEGRVAGTGKRGNLTETEGRSTGMQFAVGCCICCWLCTTQCQLVWPWPCPCHALALPLPLPYSCPALALPLPCPCLSPCPHKA